MIHYYSFLMTSWLLISGHLTVSWESSLRFIPKHVFRYSILGWRPTHWLEDRAEALLAFDPWKQSSELRFHLFTKQIVKCQSKEKVRKILYPRNVNSLATPDNLWVSEKHKAADLSYLKLLDFGGLWMWGNVMKTFVPDWQQHKVGPRSSADYAPWPRASRREKEDRQLRHGLCPAFAQDLVFSDGNFNKKAAGEGHFALVCSQSPKKPWLVAASCPLKGSETFEPHMH